MSRRVPGWWTVHKLLGTGGSGSVTAYSAAMAAKVRSWRRALRRDVEKGSFTIQPLCIVGRKTRRGTWRGIVWDNRGEG